jgi:hypothetical protein
MLFDYLNSRFGPLKRGDDCEVKEFIQNFFKNYNITSTDKRVKCIDGLRITIKGNR